MIKLKHLIKESPQDIVFGGKEISQDDTKYVEAVFCLYRNKDNQGKYLILLNRRNKVITDDDRFTQIASENFFYNINTHAELIQMISGITDEEFYSVNERLIHSRLFYIDKKLVMSFWEEVGEIRKEKNEFERAVNAAGYNPKAMVYEPADFWGTFFTYDEMFLGITIKQQPTTTKSQRDLEKYLHLNPMVKKLLLNMPVNRLQKAADKLSIPLIQLKQLLGKDVSESNDIVETMTYNDLMKNVDDGRKERSRQVRTRSIPVSVDENEESWNFRYKANPSTTGEPFQGQITFFKEIKKGDDVSNLPCKVDCGCPDFRYRFAYNDAEQDAADIGNDTLNKCINQKPKPAYDYGTGMCKHLTALSSYLNISVKNTKKSNLFEAMSDVARQKNFTFPCAD